MWGDEEGSDLTEGVVEAEGGGEIMLGSGRQKGSTYVSKVIGMNRDIRCTCLNNLYPFACSSTRPPLALKLNGGPLTSHAIGSVNVQSRLRTVSQLPRGPSSLEVGEVRGDHRAKMRPLLLYHFSLSSRISQVHIISAVPAPAVLTTNHHTAIAAIRLLDPTAQIPFRACRLSLSDILYYAFRTRLDGL